MKLRQKLPRRLVEPMSRPGSYVDKRAGAPDDAKERRRQRSLMRQPVEITPPPRDTLDEMTIRFQQQSIGAGAGASISVSCIAGEIMTGGGCHAGGAAFGTVSTCRNSYPSATATWTVFVANNSAGSLTASAYVVCVNAKLGTD